jgi:glycosyltransferase involved in cell wall biosynthesis
MPENQPFFSVIIPTYNRAGFLLRALASVQRQKFDDYEIIVVDDGSHDATADKVKGYAVRYLYQDNRGVSSARNLGVAEARGRWLAFLDADDEWLPQKLARQAKYIARHQHCRWLHCDERWLRLGRHLNQKAIHKKTGGNLFQRSLERCLISPSAVVIEADFFRDQGGFREDFPVCEDYELWLRLLAKYEVGFIPEVLLLKHGGHADQLSQRYVGMDAWRIKALVDLLADRDLTPTQREQVVATIERKATILARGYRKHGHHEQALALEQLLHRISGSDFKNQPIRFQ